MHDTAKQELGSIHQVLVELLDGVRRATTLDELNIAAGIAHDDLHKLEAAA